MKKDIWKLLLFPQKGALIMLDDNKESTLGRNTQGNNHETKEYK